jgi:hypothetical protein
MAIPFRFPHRPAFTRAFIGNVPEPYEAVENCKTYDGAEALVTDRAPDLAFDVMRNSENRLCRHSSFTDYDLRG